MRSLDTRIDEHRKENSHVEQHLLESSEKEDGGTFRSQRLLNKQAELIGNCH